MGSIAFGFTTYMIIILGVGHNTKALALGYLPLVVLGASKIFKKKLVLGFAIEFHDINVRSKEFNDLIKKIKRNYYIAHIHGNNYSKVDQESGFPSSIELTFIVKNLIKESTILSNFRYPIDGLDQPNRHSRPDIILKF